MTVDGKVYKLLKAKRCGAAFDRKVLDVMNLMGVSLGKFSICVGYRSVMNTHLTCRDECLFEAKTACLVQLVRGRRAMGARGRPSTRGNPGVTGGTEQRKQSCVRTTDEEDGKELDAESRACHRSWTMRASYLSQDRCELQFAVKELARRMQQPNKRLVRVLKGSPRCLVVYNRQAEQPIKNVFSDSDWAGCAKTRRSTSSSYVMLGGHLLAASATTQNVVATSSGEAEFYALNKSASRALGAVAMAADMVKVVKPRVRVDATASKAIAPRRGVRRITHLHTQVLWVQEAGARRELTIVKCG